MAHSGYTVVFKGLLRLAVADQQQWAPRGPPVFGPRVSAHGPLTNSVVKSFGGSFVWVLWLAHQVRSAVAAKPLSDSTASDHDSPNVPATARSVYVIVHPAAQPARLGPCVWELPWLTLTVQW